MTDFDSDRRKLLKVGGVTLTVGLAGCIGPFEDTAGVPGTVEPSDDDDTEAPDDDWLADAPNWDGPDDTVDLTGEDEVTVLNGEPEEQGVFVYEPADIVVDPGTTVTWEWAGDDTHTVTHEVGEDEEPEFNSDNIAGDGETWSYTFEEEDVYEYYCIPHRALGQLGRVTVGEPDEDVEAQIEEYLADAPNWEGDIEDRTGEDGITVLNGEVDEQGVFVFDPPAVTVDAGTTVTWEWSGDDSHSVTHEDEEFDSEILSGDGETWEHTFDEPGLYLYYCIPHRALGQKGAIIVE